MNRMYFPLAQWAWFLVSILVLSGCQQARREIRLSATVPEIEKNREAKILTAFFGLDNALPQRSRALYFKAPGKDGMPIVFSQEVDPSTLEASDFEVYTQSGDTFGVEAVTLLPAEEEFELRTALLIGDYGNHPDNPPISVKIVGELMSRAGKNFKGQIQEVIPLEEGPILSYAEYFTFTEDYPYVAEGVGCDCPRASTEMVVKAVWAGGVRATNGEELGDAELDRFEVTMVQGNDTSVVKPYQLADLGDNDNNIDLCLNVPGIPIKVAVKEHTAIDPRDDQNPKTDIEVVSRW
ncbi:hypothetical protein [Pontibacter sp. G13]|uniref:hypothetical protein n=1 Tax=Pontibacter sp. G13 TaxID=3074898 RepID=UPI0028894F13|nr:hypothetical protein [Pontibacter sp. G13]WNJ17881.1 hypothetical protein RJD25_23760 [Pontibacter sp. G13]